MQQINGGGEHENRGFLTRNLVTRNDLNNQSAESPAAQLKVPKGVSLGYFWSHQEDRFDNTVFSIMRATDEVQLLPGSRICWDKD